MKKYFRDLTDTEKEGFQPIFYMIMGKSDSGNGWRPMAWQPPFIDDEDGEEREGRLFWPDGCIAPSHTDPLEIYDHSAAMQFIALDSLRRGMDNRADGSKDILNYRLVPVYTGSERQ